MSTTKAMCISKVVISILSNQQKMRGNGRRVFIYRKCRKIIKIVFNYLDRQITAIKGRVVLPLEKLLEKVNELIGQILSKPKMKKLMKHIKYNGP